jgi:hypothetical protein
MTTQRFATAPARPAAPVATVGVPVRTGFSAAGVLAELFCARHRCPACGALAGLGRAAFVPPADYAEPAPTYWRCDACDGRFVRAAGLRAPWINASGPEFDAVFGDRRR